MDNSQVTGKRSVYADNAATTRPSAEVVAAMMPYLTEEYGNPSSIYALAGHAKKALAASRDTVAKALNAAPAEIYFTSCGTESDNWAIRGAAYANIKKGKHIITSSIEHHAVLHSCQRLQHEGWDVTYLPVDEFGLVSPDDLKNAMRPDTALVSIMAANNEIGTVEPIAEIGAICHDANVLFHTDAVQAMGHIPLDVEAMNIDLLSISGHKFYAPKGVGALYARKGVRLDNIIEGGGQEKGRRSGTENVPYIVGFAKAVSDACYNLSDENNRVNALRLRLNEKIMAIPEVISTGHPLKRLAGTASYCIKFIEGESLVLLLDMYGIQASSGSACSSGSLDPSHVLMAIGLPHEVAHGSLRLSFGRYTSIEDVDYIADTLPKVVDRLRAMSPVWDGPRIKL